MKTILLLLLIFPFAAIESTESAEISIEISGIKTSKKGNIKVAIFKKDGFLDPAKAVYKKIVTVESSTMEISFPKIEPGTYAAAIIQDQDKNGKLSTNFIGYPTEPYGFSNNQFGMFGPPDFHQVAFEVKAGKTIDLKISLQ